MPDINDDLVQALRRISAIATRNYEQDQKLRANGARSLKRIADIADAALASATTGGE